MLILPTLIKAAGTGLGILGQLGSANRYEQTADLNYQISLGNAQAQRQATLTGLRLDRIGTRIEMGAARTNLRLALAETDAQKRNADRLRQFAEARTKTSREAIRRKMREFDAFQGSQRAAIGASGVTASGSPLEVMIESASQFALAIQDANDEANFERNNTLAEAGMMEAGANRGTARALAEYGLAQRGASLSRTAITLGRNGAKTAFQSARLQAAMDRLQGQDAAQGTRLGAVGSLLQGFGGFLSDRDKINYQGIT